MDSRSSIRLLSAIAILAAMTALAPPAQATLPGRNGKIAFARSDPPNTQNIFTISPGGTGLENLTELKANSDAPVWSLDGRRLAFISDLEASGVGADNEYNLFAVSAAGGGLTQLTYGGAVDASWSPRGDAITYTAGFSGEPYVHRVDSDGTDPIPLAPGRAPEWSPDGSRIAFTGRDGRLHMIHAEGGEDRVVTTSHVNSKQWSPDGSRLAFEGFRPPPCSSPRGFCWEIGVVGADGRGERTVSQAREAYGPDWSPDSTRIAYFGERDGSWDLFAVSADGSGHTQLTSGPGFYAGPVWSPDGKSIAFLGGEHTYGVNVMSANGSDPRFLAEGQGELSWQSLPGPGYGRRRAAHHRNEALAKAPANVRGRER